MLDSIRFAPSRWPRHLRLPQPVPFAEALRRIREPGYRRWLGRWLLLVLLVVPSGLLTRILEWTGIPLRIGGAELYLTIYLPLVVCIPLVLWFGYWWGAIPAYLSTFAVAMLGGMPLPWIFLFACANPIGLAALDLAYRAFPVRADLRTLPALLYFTVTIFVSSIVGSSGSFIWAHTNRVGLNQFYPVWQGWWLGGFLQALVIVAPILMLLTPAVERWKASLELGLGAQERLSPKSILLGATTMIGTIVAYVLVVQHFMFTGLESTLDAVPEIRPLRVELTNLLEGLALPQWVLVTLVAATLFFGLRVGLSWSEEYRDLARELTRANEELRRLATTDALTGLYNRGHLLDVLPREISRARRQGLALTCLALDLDHFKKINDRYGHPAGDRVLERFAELVGARLRKEDIAARFGGEEFIVLLPDTSTAGGLRVADDIRGAIRSEEFRFADGIHKVTTSVGIAELADTGESDDGLIELADRALYRAKARGRDRTEVHPGNGSSRDA